MLLQHPSFCQTIVRGYRETKRKGEKIKEKFLGTSPISVGIIFPRLHGTRRVRVSAVQKQLT